MIEPIRMPPDASPSPPLIEPVRAATLTPRKWFRLRTAATPVTPEAHFDSEGLRNQLLLLGLLVAFIGTTSTEAYFSAFGVKYQLLGLSASHIAYRGLATIIGAWYLLVLYLTAVGWLLFVDFIMRERGARVALGGSYAILIVLIGLAYPMSRMAGLEMARHDLDTRTSALPTALSVTWKADGLSEPAYAGMRVLISSEKQVLLFRALPKFQLGVAPVIFTIASGEIRELRTSVAPASP